jgi:hypothetical protein
MGGWREKLRAIKVLHEVNIHTAYILAPSLFRQTSLHKTHTFCTVVSVSLDEGNCLVNIQTKQ